MDGDFFIVAWGNEKTPNTRIFHARAGTHCYEMRNLPHWEGQIRAAGATLQGISARLKTPTWFDEIDMFLDPERISIGTMNVLSGHTLFGWSWNSVLLLVLLLSALYFGAFKRETVVLSLVFGFFVSWGLMDLRTIYDHAVIIYKMEAYDQGMYPIKELKVFVDRAAEIIGSSTWGGGLDGVMGHFVRYRLAEKQYVPVDSDKSPEFWITLNPKQSPKPGQIVWQHDGYTLLRKVTREHVPHFSPHTSFWISCWGGVC